MKILITTDTYFPMVNGVVTSINNLYRELKNSGHDVRILTLSHENNEKIVGDVYYLKSMSVPIYPKARIKVPFYNKPLKEILDWKPDIVHSQTEFSTLFAARYISSKLNIPLLHTYHTMYEDYLDYILGGKILKRNTAAKLTKFLINSLDGVIVPTEKTKNALIKYGIDNEIHTIPTGIDITEFQKDFNTMEKQELLLNLGIKANDRIITYVGRVAEEKNIDEIIMLFDNVVKDIDNAKLLIVGGGPSLENLKAQVKELNLQNSVIFTGMVAPEEVHKYYKISEIFVTASTSETQGLTYIEALASGCPVICKWDPCLDGVITHGENGFVYTAPLEFVHFVSETLRDSELKVKLSAEASNTAKEYSSKIFADRILHSYDMTIIANRSSAAIVQLEHV